ncbi:DEAD/DEAH box helicase [bacterium]|nr:DEAD/DEAH box helicase [bacterium]
MSFQTLGLHDTVLKAVIEKGYTEATPIQLEAIPAILNGRDVIAGAQTGTGKTAAYGLPIIHRLVSTPANSPSVLVLVPTRELALQIRTQLGGYAKHTPVRVVAIYGGAPMKPQIDALKRKVDVVVATPGRLQDHVRRRTLSLSQMSMVVLDEADRMLDMGFLPAITEVLEQTPSNRQTLLFSATFDEPIRRLAQTLMQDPLDIRIHAHEAVSAAITHRAHPVDQPQKMALLDHIVGVAPQDQVLIFVRTKSMADQLARHLTQSGQRSESIHGDKSQAQRMRILNGFRSGNTRLLVATDVAARGLDIPLLPMVVNFDLPLLPEDYIHRIGRTGRAGSSGMAVSLVTSNEGHLIKRINQRLSAPIEFHAMDGYAPKDAHWMDRLQRSMSMPAPSFRGRPSDGNSPYARQGQPGKARRSGSPTWDRRTDWRSRSGQGTGRRDTVGAPRRSNGPDRARATRDIRGV